MIILVLESCPPTYMIPWQNLLCEILCNKKVPCCLGIHKETHRWGDYCLQWYHMATLVSLYWCHFLPGGAPNPIPSWDRHTLTDRWKDATTFFYRDLTIFIFSFYFIFSSDVQALGVSSIFRPLHLGVWGCIHGSHPPSLWEQRNLHEHLNCDRVLWGPPFPCVLEAVWRTTTWQSDGWVGRNCLKTGIVLHVF